MVLLIALALLTFLQSHESVEIALEEPVLGYSVFLKLALGVFPGNLGADAPGVWQHVLFRILPLGALAQVVRRIRSFLWSARFTISSAAVWPCTA